MKLEFLGSMARERGGAFLFISPFSSTTLGHLVFLFVFWMNKQPVGTLAAWPSLCGS